CYDRVEVRLLDVASGAPACSARVIAQSRDGDEVRFTSCFHAALDAGEWSVRADQPGYATASTTVIVPDAPGCDSAVQTIELSLVPNGYQPPELPAAQPAPAGPSAPPAPPPVVAQPAPAAPAQAAPDRKST